MKLQLVAPVLLLVVQPSVLAAQWTQDSIRHQPVTAAGAYAVHWTVDEGIGQHTVYVRNRSTDREVTIRSWRVNDCINLRIRSCGKQKGNVTIAPGQSIRLGVIHRDVAEREYSFRYTLAVEWTQPPDSTSAIADSTSR